MGSIKEKPKLRERKLLPMGSLFDGVCRCEGWYVCDMCRKSGKKVK